MKDERGHGSDARSGGYFGQRSAPIRGQVPLLKEGATFPSMTSQQTPSTAQTIADLRERMRGTGPGHADALSQSIRNLQGAAIPNSGRRKF